MPGRDRRRGTVVNEAQAKAVIDAGVEFIVSPGLTEASRARSWTRASLICRHRHGGDIMRGLDLGLTHFKFFPAETSGGLKALKALAAPFYQCRFCPTGGITEASAPDGWRSTPSCASGQLGHGRQHGRRRSQGPRGKRIAALKPITNTISDAGPVPASPCVTAAPVPVRHDYIARHSRPFRRGHFDGSNRISTMIESRR